MASSECLSCGETFDTERGLDIHYAAKHGGRFLNRTCDRCGRRFRSEHRRKYCSEACRDEAVTFAGSPNPNYRGAKEITECVLCEREFEYYSSEKKGLYCSDCVENAEWRTLPDITREDNPRWNGGKVETDCDVCGKTVTRYPSGLTGEACLCSEDCRRHWLSEAFSGEGHPNWQGGSNHYYGPGWRKIREKALDRDGYRCRICGKPSEEIGRNPDAHHIVPVRWFAESPDYDTTGAHRIENVISLRVKCHRKADFGYVSPDALRDLIEAGTSTGDGREARN